jgi:hypothetical protein
MADYLAQFKQWKSIESIENPEEIIKNEEFDKKWKEATPEQTSEMQNRVKDSFIWNEKIDIKKFEDKPWYPIIERFTNIDWIKLTNEEKISILEWVWKSNNIQNVINWLDKSINQSTLIDTEKKQFLQKYLHIVKKLNKKSNINENQEIKKQDLPKVFWNYTFLSNFEDKNVQLLASNYLILPDWINWEPDTNKDLETAFQVTVNKIIEWKQISKNESFEIAMNDIQKWNIEEKFYALKYINTLVQTSQWSKWWKNRKDFKQMKEKHNLKKKEYLDFKIDKIEKLILKSWNDSEKLKYELELETLQEEKNEEDFEWEVFSWWKLDKQNESWEKEQQI